mgnify:CR=1 FL=1
MKDAVPFCMQTSLKILQNINLCEITTKRIEDENRGKKEKYVGILHRFTEQNMRKSAMQRLQNKADFG